ncbi:MAG: hypothetical protein ACTSQ8_20965 [Candidatus Helarchaeota archaeon]
MPLTLGVILIISYVRGVNTFGFEKATASFRSWLYFYSTLIFTLVVGESTHIIRNVISSWNTSAWILFWIAILRWLMLATGFIEVVSGNTTELRLTLRVINAQQTFILLQAVIFAFILKIGKFYRQMPALFIPAIILLQHRTVWAVFLYFIGIVLIQRKQKNILLIVIILLLMSLSAILLILVSETSVALSLRESALNFNTFYWRMEGWGQLLSPNRFNSSVDYFIGQPFGTSFARYITSSSGVAYITEVSPHNFFILTVLTIGIIGLIILMTIYYQAIAALLKQKKINFAFAFALILISQLIFSISYRPSYEQGFLLGAAVILSEEIKKL